MIPAIVIFLEGNAWFIAARRAIRARLTQKRFVELNLFHEAASQLTIALVKKKNVMRAGLRVLYLRDCRKNGRETYRGAQCMHFS